MRNSFCRAAVFVAALACAGHAIAAATNGGAHLKNNNHHHKMQGLLSRKEGDHHNRVGAKIPPWFDWRTYGAVTPVQYEGQCGTGTVALTIADVITGVNFVTNNKLVAVSAEQLVDCGSQDGCCGSMPSWELDYLFNNTGGRIATNASYPWTAGFNGTVGVCRTTGWTTGATVLSEVKLPKDEAQLAQILVETGPFLVVIDPTALETYTGGIIQNCPFQQYEHLLLAVGYNDVHNPPYWIFKNTWGPSWGEGGYVRIAKGKNECGLAGWARSVTVKKDQ